MCGGGGSGGGGTTQYNWNDTLAPQWANAISWARGLTDPTGAGAYQQYHGPDASTTNPDVYLASSNDPTHRISNLSNDQLQAMNYGENIANMSSNPIPAMDAARSQITNTLGGNYLNGSQQDPYASASNPYGGMNSPYFDQTLQNGLGNMAKAYQLGTSADTTRQMNLAGVLGGSANQNAVATNENTLANQMGQYISGMQNDQYNRSAQLADAGLNRGSAAYQAERGRQTQDISAGQNEQGLAIQRQQDLMGIGDAQRGYTQDLLNQGYGDWQAQQNRQFTMLDYLSGLLGRAQGGVSPNVTTTQSGYSASPYAQAIGAGLIGYGLTK